jgi:hypothetical protein
VVVEIVAEFVGSVKKFREKAENPIFSVVVTEESTA